MKALQHAPLFKFALAFCLGIVLESHLTHWVSVPLIGIPLYAWYVYRDHRFVSRRYELGMAGLIFLLGIGLGGGRAWVDQAQPESRSIQHFNCERVQLAGVVRGQVKTNAYGRRAWLEIFAIAQGNDCWEAQSGKVQAYFSLKDSSEMQSFDTLLVEANLRDLSSKYPDYLTYLHRNGIELAAYVKQTQVRGHQQHAKAIAWDWQQWLSGRVADLMRDSVLTGVAQGMFLGNKAHLDPEVREAFARAGLSHLLAISGLHLGIIVLVLGHLFSPLHVFRQGRKIRQVVVLAVLIWYVLITGASPAVVRAGIMFGTVVLFRLFHQRFRMLNVLAVSALGQCLYDPQIFFELGFQLSYCAVWGIVALLPKLEAWCSSPYPFLNKCYAAIGVTLTATVATTPLVVIHFGQFPTYFLLANLCTAFLSFLCVLVGFLLVLLQGIPMINEWLGWLCERLLMMLVDVCLWISELPYATIEGFSWQEKGWWMLVLQLGLCGLFMLAPKLRFSTRKGIKQLPVSPAMSG
ncbi:MAG: ComEC/Rec2 family competence protein [Bacteroidota bacterium]